MILLDDYYHQTIKGNRRRKEVKRMKIKLKSPANTCCLTSHNVCFVFIIILYMTSLCFAVTVHEVKFISDSGKSDYVLSGEGVTLSCLFLTDPAEEVISLEWIKDTNNSIYLWRNNKDTIPYVSPLIRDHLNNTNNNSALYSLHLTNTSVNLHGSYSCQITSSKGTSSNEVFVIVIQDSNCQESAFSTHSDLVSCTEDITFYCRGFFPKPSPVCGLYSDFTGSYIQSIPFDRIERREEDGTYEVSLFRRLHARDWVQYKKHKLSFRCFVIVMSTTWRRGIHHRLFGPVGCPNDPPIVRSGHYNLSSSEGETCWQTPREGATVRYNCDAGFDLLGPESLICSADGLWKESNNAIRDQFGERRTVCNFGISLQGNSQWLQWTLFSYALFLFLNQRQE